MFRFDLLLSAAATLPTAGWPQTLEQRISTLESGKVHLSLPLDQAFVATETRTSTFRTTKAALRTFVGGHWRNAPASKDLGTIRPQEAAAYFLHLAGSRSDLSGDPMLPATLAEIRSSGNRHCSGWARATIPGPWILLRRFCGKANLLNGSSV